MTVRLKKEHAAKIYTEAFHAALKFYGFFESGTLQGITDDMIGTYISRYVMHKFDEIEKNPKVGRDKLDGQFMLPFPNEVVFDFEDSKIINEE